MSEKYDDFCEKVKWLSFRMCEYMGHPAEEEVILSDGQTFIQKYWLDYEHMVREWLIMEAFSKLRNEYWTKDI